jgi:hypothetical protein
MDPQTYRRWDQVPKRSKNPMLTGHTRREPSSIIMNAELSAVKVSVPSTEKCQTTCGSMKVCKYELDHCNGHRTCKTLTSNDNIYDRVVLWYLECRILILVTFDYYQYHVYTFLYGYWIFDAVYSFSG